MKEEDEEEEEEQRGKLPLSQEKATDEDEEHDGDLAESKCNIWSPGGLLTDVVIHHEEGEVEELY